MKCYPNITSKYVMYVKYLVKIYQFCIVKIKYSGQNSNVKIGQGIWLLKSWFHTSCITSKTSKLGGLILFVAVNNERMKSVYASYIRVKSSMIYFIDPIAWTKRIYKIIYIYDISYSFMILS